MPIVFVIAVIPLIMRIAVIPVDKAVQNFWWIKEGHISYYFYHKMISLVFAGGISAMFLLYNRFKHKDYINSKYKYSIVVYVVFVLLSAAFSKNTAVSIGGFPGRFEGILTLLSYILIMVAAITFIKSEEQVRFVLGSLFISASIITTIGLLQYFKFDITDTKIFEFFVFPTELRHYIEAFKQQYNRDMITSTLSYYNYVGSYYAMLVPLTLALLIFNKDVKLKIRMGLIATLFGSVWLLCGSRAGMLGGIIGILMILIIVNKRIFTQIRYLVVGIVIISILFISLNEVSKIYGAPMYNIVKRMQTIVSDVKNGIFEKDIDENIGRTILKDIILSTQTATIITNTETLKMTVNSNFSLLFSNSEGKYINTNLNPNNTISINDKQYIDYKIYINDTKGNQKLVTIIKNSMRLMFGVSEKEIKLVDFKGNEIQLKSAEKWGFEGREMIGSKRGYIWSRSIPLLKHTLLLGYGPDNFVFYFPQYDFSEKSRFFSDMWRVIDRPHSFYLQTAINTGVISFLAILTLFGTYIIQSFRLYFGREFDSFTQIAGVGIFAAVCGYLVAGLFNDSVVSVAPVFWCLLGMGISINSMVKQKTEAVSDNSIPDKNVQT